MNSQFKRILEGNKFFINNMKYLFDDNYKNEIKSETLLEVLNSKKENKEIEIVFRHYEKNYIAMDVKYENISFWFHKTEETEGIELSNVSKDYFNFNIIFSGEENNINSKSNFFIIDLYDTSSMDKYVERLIPINQDIIDKDFIGFVLMTKDIDISSLEGISINDFMLDKKKHNYTYKLKK